MSSGGDNSASSSATCRDRWPVSAYISVGDYQHHSDWLPLDSEDTINALFEAMAEVNNVKRVYWRGHQDRIWDDYFVPRPEAVWTEDLRAWIHHLNARVGTNDIALAAAKQHGMELYVFEGILEHGAQGDIGGNNAFPYPSEDSLRVEHPEWAPVDRWGERVAPGPLEFCYPEARAKLVERLTYHVCEFGYDGICFYTYVENKGTRYPEEFGFNEPIVEEFGRRHGVDIRREPFDKEAWARLRGEYFTRLLRELHEALSAKGKKLGIVLDNDEPHLPQRWGGMGFPGAGLIHMDWEGWVREGVVDQLVAWFRGSGKEKRVGRMLEVCKGTPVEVLYAEVDPFAEKWKSFLEAGARPFVAPDPGCKGAERFTAEPVTASSLGSPTWGARMQALLGIESGALQADVGKIAGLVSDAHTLVRREAIRVLAKLGATQHVGVIEKALDDEESSVRIAAANALAEVNGPDSVDRILGALNEESMAQMKEATILALGAMQEQARPRLVKNAQRSSLTVREVCVRALETDPSAEAEKALLQALREDEDHRIRYWAARGLAGRGTAQVVQGLLSALGDPAVAVQVEAVRSLGNSAPKMTAGDAERTLCTLEQRLREYGDGSTRPDAAWGWRPAGNALKAFGGRGEELLEAMRTQKEDKWLAWAAYLVVYAPQTITDGAILTNEQDDIETHQKYAPPFPGHRT